MEPCDFWWFWWCNHWRGRPHSWRSQVQAIVLMSIRLVEVSLRVVQILSSKQALRNSAVQVNTPDHHQFQAQIACFSWKTNPPRLAPLHSEVPSVIGALSDLIWSVIQGWKILSPSRSLAWLAWRVALLTPCRKASSHSECPNSLQRLYATFKGSTVY